MRFWRRAASLLLDQTTWHTTTHPPTPHTHTPSMHTTVSICLFVAALRRRPVDQGRPAGKGEGAALLPPTLLHTPTRAMCVVGAPTPPTHPPTHQHPLHRVSCARRGQRSPAAQKAAAPSSLLSHLPSLPSPTHRPTHPPHPQQPWGASSRSPLRTSRATRARRYVRRVGGWVG